ncbi:MAG: tetratricopeptide repeat protein, partial [Pyrinomonadaceae bacterium]
LVIYLCGTGNEQSVMYLKTKNAEGKEVPGWYTVINPYRIPRRIFDANPNTPAKKIKWAALGPANPSTRAYELTIDKYSEWISTRAGRLSLLGGTAEGPTTAAKPSPTPGTLDADKKPAAAAGAVAAEIRSQTELEEERELVIKFAGLIAKGNAQRVANNYSGAEQAYSDANKLIPSDSRSLYGLGNVYFDQQRWKGAEEAYRRAISLNSHFPEAYLALAKVLIGPRKGEINADRLFEAENYLWITASLQPQNEKVYNLLDTVLEKRRASTAEFEAVYRRVLKLSPESVGTNLRLSSLLRRLGRQDEAKKHLQIAETAASGLEELLDLAEVFESQKRYNKAERLARRALSLDSNSKDGRAPLILGLVLIDREQYLAAVPWLQRATQASRDDFIPRYLLGIARLRSGDLDNAERSFDEAIGKVSAPEQESYATACWLVLLGDAYSVTGRKSDAVRVYERALTYDPDDSETRDKLSKIRTTLKP